MKRQSKPDVLQVEQLFDDGTHPAIHEPLPGLAWLDDMRQRFPDGVPISFPACPGQMTIEERKCYCPDDCACQVPWRLTICGCKGHTP